MASTINAYISHEFVTNQELLPLSNDAKLIESRILDSLSLMQLVLFIEQRFGVVVSAEELVPENFESVDVIVAYLRTKKAKTA